MNFCKLSFAFLLRHALAVMSYLDDKGSFFPGVEIGNITNIIDGVVPVSALTTSDKLVEKTDTDNIEDARKSVDPVKREEDVTKTQRDVATDEELQNNKQDAAISNLNDMSRKLLTDKSVENASLSQRSLESFVAGHEPASVENTHNCTSLTNLPKNVRCLYINLDRRTDRREGFLAHTQKFLEPLQRCNDWTLERFSAVDRNDVIASNNVMADAGKSHPHLPGAVAAAQSHINALKLTVANLPHEEIQTSSPVLIFEDDYRFHGEPIQVLQRMQLAFQYLKDTWDVVMFGDNSYDNHADVNQSLEQAAQIGRTTGAWCSEAYMVSPRYILGLINTTEAGLQLMKNGSMYVHTEVEPQGAAYDTLWQPLQKDPNSKWVVFRPKLGEQADTMGDSDIIADRPGSLSLHNARFLHLNFPHPGFVTDLTATSFAVAERLISLKASVAERVRQVDSGVFVESAAQAYSSRSS